MKKSNQQGFTLIELIIVIVILGILAVTASPKFLDIQTDARSSTVDGLEASLKGAVNIAYSKALIQGVKGTPTTPESTTGTSVIAMVYGYPDASAISDVIDDSDWQIIEGDTTTRIYPSDVTYATGVTGDTFTEGTDPAHEACYVQYVEAASDGAEPTISQVITGC
ncbi:MAG: prepilin-type N-terminal cleavage/methylation domain-containing protein [Gammaproteobacteria bacterium]|nr:prepilin-type N-terminal cleavage/methylation domain-containing protein [Gammaproteobacteria bacterium]